MAGSKPLGHDDSSGFDFSQEMLAGDKTYGINFDRIQWDSKEQRFVIVEYLLCSEDQFSRNITPFTSHPNRYFKINPWKFLSLWDVAHTFDAKLYLVNYSKKGTKFEDEVLLMEVEYIDPQKTPIVKTADTKFTRSEFSKWFRDLNSRGQR